MAVSNHLFSNVLNRSGVHNLALFICHLFIGGNFRFGQILYDPKVFDGHLTAEIHSVCSVQIPWQTNDITRITALPNSNNCNNRTDHILQLIFLDSNKLPGDIQKFEKLFTFYRNFVFPSTRNETELKRRIFLIGQMNPILNSSTLLLHYNLDNGLINVHLTSETYEPSKKNLLSFDSKTLNQQENMHLFDQTFGKYEQTQLIAVNAPLSYRKEEDYTNFKSHIPNLGFTYHANYFFSSLNATYLNVSCTVFTITTPPFSQIVTQKQRKYYKELNLEYEPIKKERLAELEREHINNLHFGSYAMDNKGVKTHFLYPYGSTKLAVMFVYGTDFRRQLNVLKVPAIVKLMALLIVLFMILSIFVLRKMRSKLNLQRADYSSTVMDVLIAFTAGGNLTVRHKIERWFFTILLIGAFFMIPIFTSELLNEMYRMQHQKITLKQLAKMSAPIYINPAFAPQVEQVHEMIRQKMGPKINYKGIATTIKLAPYHNGSFIYVGEAYRPENFLSTFVINERDFDLLEETLGSVNTNYYLQSDHYVTERLLNRINAKTSSILENGLHHFYLSYTDFQRKLFGREYMKPKEDFEALTMSQLKRPLIVFLVLRVINIFVFIAEKIIFKRKNRIHNIHFE